MIVKRFIAAVTALTFATSSQAMTMEELFDSVNADANISNPAMLQAQTMNLYTGGSLFMRMPKRTYNLATVTPPSFSAGCGGIDLYMGGFSYINKDQFVAMLRNIGSNALGYAFKLALQNLCPTCDNVMQSLQATANAVNRMNVDSCEAAKGIVNASLGDTWQRGRQNAAKNFGVNTNVFSDITDAWRNVMPDETKTNQAMADAEAKDPTIKDALPKGNVVWKALKRMDGIDDEYRMVLMSMIGTVILDASTDGPRIPAWVPNTDFTVARLVKGAEDSLGNITVPIWRCDTTSEDGCLNPYQDKITVKSFKTMVREKLWMITEHLSGRSPYPDKDAVVAFLDVTDLPIYKMLAVTTSAGSTGMTDVLMGRYEELIAAKYAETYVQRAVADLRAALRNLSVSTNESVASALDKVQPNMDKVSAHARETLATAYSQTISTYNIALEVQSLERAMTTNLSQTLRTSLAFGKSLR